MATWFRDAVPVLPTPTELFTLDVRGTRWLAVEVRNPDATQTVSVYPYRRAHPEDAWAPSAQPPEFVDIPAGEARSVDYDTGVQMEVKFEAVASGVGVTCDVTALPAGGRP